MACSTVWNQSCLSFSCANISSCSQKEPVLRWTLGQHISGISHLFHQLSIGSQCLSSWPAGQKEASVKHSKAAAAQRAGAGRSSTTSILCLLHFPFGFLCLFQLNKQNSEMPLRTGLCHISMWLLHSKNCWGDCVPQFHYLIVACQRDRLKGRL